MVNFDDATEKHTRTWSKLAIHSWSSIQNINNWRFWIRKKNALLNHTLCTENIYFYAKDPHQTEHQFLITKREVAGLRHCNDSKAFIDCQNNLDDIYENNADYDQNKEYKILIAFDDMISDMISNKKLIQLLIWLAIKKLIQ